jgi:pSer/pThr/pTyr-binding forkhead associated (FHA) protein/tetratricopeptide (TPR) repeat protein
MVQLEVENLQGQTSQVDLTAPEYILGRDASVAVVLDDQKVSRRHARLFRRDAGYFIEDLGSANGVVVNGTLITAATAAPPGTHILICGFNITVHDAQGSAKPAAGAANVKASAQSFVLEAANGPTAGQSVTLPQGQTVAGRTADCGLPLDDPSISRRHAAFTVAGQQLTVEDLKSSNGVFVNDQRCTQQALHPGDSVRLGNVVLQVRSLGAAQGRAAAKKSGRRPVSLSAVGLAAGLMLVCAAISFLAFERFAPGGSHGPAVASAAEVAFEAEVHGAMQQAQSFAAAKQWDTAVGAYQKVLKLDPAHPAARTGLAMATANRDQGAMLQQAQEALRQGLPLKALDAASLIGAQSAYATAAQELLEQAREAAEKKRLALAHTACRTADWKRCQLEAATLLVYLPTCVTARALIQEAEDALRSGHLPYSPWDPGNRARVATSIPAGEVRQALLRCASGDWETALRRLKMFRAQPGAAAVYSALLLVQQTMAQGDTAFANGDLPGAQVLWERAEGLNTKILGPTAVSVVGSTVGSRLANGLQRLGQQAFDRGNYAEAATQWRRALLKDPQHPLVPDLLTRLEARAEALLADLRTLPKLDAPACSRLQEVIDMTLPAGATHRAAVQLKKHCLTPP